MNRMQPPECRFFRHCYPFLPLVPNIVKFANQWGLLRTVSSMNYQPHLPMMYQVRKQSFRLCCCSCRGRGHRCCLCRWWGCWRVVILSHFALLKLLFTLLLPAPVVEKTNSYVAVYNNAYVDFLTKGCCNVWTSSQQVYKIFFLRFYLRGLYQWFWSRLRKTLKQNGMTSALQTRSCQNKVEQYKS